MPRLARVREVVDNRLNTLWNDRIAPRQWLFYRNNGQFAQLVASHPDIAIPSNDDNALDIVAETLVTRHLATKTDTTYTWNEVMGINLGAITLPMSIRIDNYGNLQGHGFIAHVFVRWDNKLYTRSREAFAPNGTQQASDVIVYLATEWQHVS